LDDKKQSQFAALLSALQGVFQEGTCQASASSENKTQNTEWISSFG
jgi:hypothetical protein